MDVVQSLDQWAGFKKGGFEVAGSFATLQALTFSLI